MFKTRQVSLLQCYKYFCSVNCGNESACRCGPTCPADTPCVKGESPLLGWITRWRYLLAVLLVRWTRGRLFLLHLSVQICAHNLHGWAFNYMRRTDDVICTPALLQGVVAPACIMTRRQWLVCVVGCVVGVVTCWHCRVLPTAEQEGG